MELNLLVYDGVRQCETRTDRVLLCMIAFAIA
jgi:hypothetical protein